MDVPAQCRYLVATYSPLLASLDDSHRALAAVPGGKTAGWLVGHLCTTGDYARRLCGKKPPLCPVEWRTLFNPGTKPSTNAGDYPPMKTLVEQFHAVYSDLASAYPTAGDELLGVENPFAPGRPDFPTAGDFAAYLMTGHLGYHLGQLSGWRAAAGVK